MYHFSLHLKFCKNTCKLFWKYFCFAFIHYRRAQFILSKFANFCLSKFSMFCLKFSLLKPHPKNTPHFNTSFVKISENFSTPLHLFIRVPIYPFHVICFYLFSLFCLHWKFTYICSRWNKTTPVKQASLELRFLTWLHTAQVTTKVTICRQCELCQFGRWIFCKSAKILLYWSRANVQGIGKCLIYLAKGM